MTISELQEMMDENEKFYNEKAQKPYNELTPEQKFIDKYIADRINTDIKQKVGILR